MATLSIIVPNWPVFSPVNIISYATLGNAQWFLNEFDIASPFAKLVIVSKINILYTSLLVILLKISILSVIKTLFFNKEGIIDSTTGEELLNWLNSGEEVNIDNDFDIFSEISNCSSVEALNTYYKFNVNAVQDKDKFIELCGQQKEKLQKKTFDKIEQKWYS